MKLVMPEKIEKQIFSIRNRKIMLDSDLAELYGVQTSHLNKAVKRNRERFPSHFMFQLTPEEFEGLKSHLDVDHPTWGGRRTPPYAFTEQGVAMLSSVLHSKRAIQVNIVIMDTFVRLRQLMASHQDLARKIHQLEKRYNSQFKVVFDALRQLMAPPVTVKRKIGF